jgi:hypothetical protein
MTAVTLAPDAQLYLAIADALDIELGHRVSEYGDPADRLAGNRYLPFPLGPASAECRARADVLRSVADPATRASVGQATVLLNAVETFARQLDMEVNAEAFLRCLARDMIGYWEDSSACLCWFDEKTDSEKYVPEGYGGTEMLRKLGVEFPIDD